MFKLKLTKIGNSVGVVLPKEMLAQLKIEAGDVIFATDSSDGFLLTPYDAELEVQLLAGRAFIKEYRETFKALAK